MQTRYERWLNRMGKIILYDPERRFAGLGDSFPAGETAEHRTLHTFTAEDQLLFYLEEVDEDVDILIVNLVRQKDTGAGLARACKNRIHHLKLVLVIDRLEWPEHLFELQPDSLLFFPLDQDDFQRTILRLEQMAQKEDLPDPIPEDSVCGEQGASAQRKDMGRRDTGLWEAG